MRLFVSLVLLLIAISAEAHSQYAYRRDYFRISLSVGKNRYQADGNIASYSNVTFAEISGQLYNANEDFGCDVDNETVPLSPPFLLFAPLSDSCDDYVKALAAQRLGAAAVIFYTTDSRRTFTNKRIPDLKVAVTRITISQSSSIANALIRGSEENVQPVVINGLTVQATIYLSRNQPTSRTFYFVVFAFSLLILLSLMWFIISYVKRMLRQCSQRRRRVAAQQAAHKAIVKLPTRTIKTAKEQKGDDDIVCAVCLEAFARNDCVRVLPCKHEFHKRCVDPWLQSKSTCPLCKYNIVSGRQNCPSSTVAVTSPFETNWSQRERPPLSPSADSQSNRGESEDVPASVVIIGEHSDDNDAANIV